MSAPLPRRIARIRPKASAKRNPLTFFAGNDAADSTSPEGRIWTLLSSPFPGSPGNRGSAWTGSWHAGVELSQDDFAFLAPCVPANVFGRAHNTGDPEAELAAVVGIRSRSLTPANARAALLGFTIGNGVSTWILTGNDPTAFADAAIDIVPNGSERASGGSADLGQQIDEILVSLSSTRTLYPGDIILTGFPAECRRPEPEDAMSCRAKGVGQLGNRVRSRR